MVLYYNRYEEQCIRCSNYITNTDEECMSLMNKAGIECSCEEDCLLPFECTLFTNEKGKIPFTREDVFPKEHLSTESKSWNC